MSRVVPISTSDVIVHCLYSAQKAVFISASHCLAIKYFYSHITIVACKIQEGRFHRAKGCFANLLYFDCKRNKTPFLAQRPPGTPSPVWLLLAQYSVTDSTVSGQSKMLNVTTHSRIHCHVLYQRTAALEPGLYEPERF